MFPSFEFSVFPAVGQLYALPVYFIGAILVLMFVRILFQAVLAGLGLQYFTSTVVDMILMVALFGLAMSALSGHGSLAAMTNRAVEQALAPIMEVARALEGVLPY